MSLVDYFIQLYDYNCWANWRVLQAARELSEEQLAGSSGIPGAVS